MAGLFLGAFCGGAVAERFGRKFCMMLGLVTNTLSYILIAFMPNVYGYMIMRLFVMATGHMNWIWCCFLDLNDRFFI